MTIEEKIQEKIKKKADEYGKLAQIFIEGAEFALDNQWISVEEDLPCNRKELTYWTGDTTDVLVTGLTSKDGFRFRHITHMSKNDNSQGRWYWVFPYEVSHWMPYPKVPKENYNIQLNAQN